MFAQLNQNNLSLGAGWLNNFRRAVSFWEIQSIVNLLKVGRFILDRDVTRGLSKESYRFNDKKNSSKVKLSSFLVSPKYLSTNFGTWDAILKYWRDLTSSRCFTLISISIIYFNKILQNNFYRLSIFEKW